MSQQTGFFGQLLYRRVPQYLGLYIAGVWMAIEIGDWLTDQFALPNGLTAFTFVFLAAMLPSVAVFAWTHGAPGKDASNRFERAFIPANLLIAVALVFIMPARQGGPDGAAVADATTATEEASVATGARISSQRIFVFFPRNDTTEAPDWIAYSASVLLSRDLDRSSPRVGAVTPFNNSSTLERMRRAGFERAIGEPLTVQLDMTRRARFQRLVRATLRDGGDAGEFSLNWALHDAEDGSVLISGQRPFDKARVFEAVDDVTAEILTYVNEQLDSPLKLTDVPVAETVTPNVDALEQYVTSRMIKELDQNETDYVESLQRAVEIDSQFAEAHAGLGFYHYFRGDTEAAIAALDTALQYDYRLSTESRFNVQINRQATASNQAEALRIAETWTRVEPENEFAFYRLAALQKARSDMLDEAAASYKRVLEINPQAEEAYLSLADLEIQRQNWDAASEYAQAFSELNPEDYAGQIKLAQILAASGRYDEAIATYEQAGYLQSNTIGPPLGIVSVLARRGDFSNALDRIASLQQRRLTDNERLQLLTSQVQVLTLAGRFSDAIARMEEEREVAQRVMQPLLYQLQYRGQLIMMGASAGESIDSVVGQLAALREEMQPPFSSAIHWYEASLFAVLGKKPEYIDAFARSKAFFDMQAGNDVIKPVRLGAEARLHVYEGDNALGLEALRESLRLSEASILNMVSASESYLLRASLYDLMREAGEPRDAVEGLQTIVDAFPGLAVGHLYLAKAYVDLGQWRRAETAIRRAEDLWANADAGLHYLEEIADLRAALDAV